MRTAPSIQTKSGMREHPLLKAELANQAFVCRSLQASRFESGSCETNRKATTRMSPTRTRIGSRKACITPEVIAAYQRALKLHNDAKSS
jgi:hypothetical protein